MLAHQLLEPRGRSHNLVVECMHPTMDRIRLLNGNHSIKIVHRLRALTLYPDLSLSYQHIHGGGSRFWMRAKTPVVEIVNIHVKSGSALISAGCKQAPKHAPQCQRNRRSWWRPQRSHVRLAGNPRATRQCLFQETAAPSNDLRADGESAGS